MINLYSKPQLLQLPKIHDKRGNLTFIEGNIHIPFDIMRTYWIYDVPGGETRGGHAFREQEEFIVALSGSFEVVVDDGENKKTYNLNRSYNGLYIPKGNWRCMNNFSTNSLALVLASTVFELNDYIFDYVEFLNFTKNIKNKLLIEKLYNKRTVAKDIDLGISTVYDCRIIPLDVNHREKGNITVIEKRNIIPFDIKRVYFLYDVPGGVERGGHAHKELSQLIVAASGSFDVVLNDGTCIKTVTLNRPYQGLYIIPGIWREIVNFSSGSICLVLASEYFSESDYLRDYCEFLNFKNV